MLENVKAKDKTSVGYLNKHSWARTRRKFHLTCKSGRGWLNRHPSVCLCSVHIAFLSRLPLLKLSLGRDRWSGCPHVFRDHHIRYSVLWRTRQAGVQRPDLPPMVVEVDLGRPMRKRATASAGPFLLG